MNNIYKVIWSKAKNCYVVASEIARSHTKSATGSEKIGGVTRRSLLASLMALSLLCGGLGVASAANGTVHVAESSMSSDPAVYTTEKVDTLLNDKADKTALENKANAIDVTKNTGNIATNTANIKTLQSELGNKADESNVTTALGGKANIDLSNLTEAGKSAIKNTMSADMDSKANKADVYSRTGADDKFATKDALNGKADQTALNQATDRITVNEAAITGLTKKTTDQQTAIDDLKKKTAEISHEAGSGTSISGVTIKDGNILGNGNSAITGLTNVETNKIKTDSINGKSLTGTTVATATEVADAVKVETDARIAADIALEEKITKNSQDIATLGGKVTTAQGDIQTNANNIQTNSNAIADTNDRTGGIKRNTEDTQTTIEEKVTVNKSGDVDGVKGLSAETINTTGDAKVGGALTVTGASDLKGDVTLGTPNGANTVTVNGKSDFNEAVNMDNGLTVTNGDTSLKKTDVDGALTVTGESSLKNTTVGGTLNVTDATTLNGALTAEKDATFEKNVTVQNDLTVDGKLNVDKISMKNNELKNGKKHDSATTITADEISNLAKVTEQGNTTESQFTHNEKGTFNHARDGNNADWKESNSNVTADGVSNKMTDSDGNRHTYYQTAAESKEQLVNGNKSNFERKTAEGNTISIKDKDADGNKKSLTNTQTVDGEKTSVTNKDSSSTINQGADQIRYNVTSKDENKTSSSIEVKADGITNTSKDGTITNDAKDIVNNASGNISNKSQTMDTTVTGKATESYGSLDTTVNGNETHIVKGTKAETVEGKVTENYKAGQATNVTGDQDIKVSGTQTTTATDIKRNASSGMIDTIDNDYGTNTETKVAGSTTTEVSIKGTDESGTYIRGATEARDYIIKGTLSNSETKTAEATSTEITDGTNKASTIQKVTDLAGSVTNGKETGVSGIHAKDNSVSIDSIVTDGNKSYSVINQKKGSIQSTVVDGTSSTVILQDKDNVTIASSNGMVGIVGKDIVNNAQNTITNTAGTKITDKVSTNTRVIDSTSITDTVGTANRKIEDGKITDTAGDFTVTTENGNGTTFAKKTGSTAYSTEVGAPTDTNIAGNLITTGRVDANELGVSDKDDQGNTADLSVKAGEGIKSSATDKDGNKTYTKVTATENSFQVQDKDGKNKNHQVNTMGSSVTEITDKDGNTTKTEQTATDITNEASNSITDKVGTNTRVLNKDGITDTVGGSTFKQRINAIMMESKDVSIKAEETLTNEAKVITNKASEVINNEAVNINNTATGIITSKASEIQNQADKLISNKVGENTWENMENGKITTSIKDGTKQNLTQSDAAGTTQSTVDGGKSTVTIQNADGLTDVVTNGKNTSIQNQTASAIQAAVKDQAGNENASLTDATTSANTIKNGTKANTVISTVDGTSFINSEAAAPVTGASGVGTAKNTTIKGNTITTGKVTMDYADVMKDLGVRGNANITGKTTTGSLEVTGTSTLKGNVTMESNATIKGDVTARSYKVGDKTYISAAGINANDQKITNVADGSISEGSKDAVNGGQLYTVKNDLEGKVNKVGANAAAMANLHPMEFDPDSKWNIAAAIGNYGSETAAALGAFYRPNDDVMVNLSTAFGTGENMVGGGVSVRLGKGGNKLSREENNALKDQVNDLTARMDALLSVLNPNMSKDFPDVPENHWAYEAVSRLAGNDIVQGYPDGEFHGERTMTRYEMAEIIYNALSRGAEAERELVEEFKPELQAMAASEKATAERAEG